MTSLDEFIYLVEIEAYDPSVPGVTTLRYTSGRGKNTGPLEVPANVHFEGRLLNPINFTRTAFSDSRVMGGGQMGYGEIVLSNIDQELSPLLDYGLDGRKVTIRTGVQSGAYPSDYTVFFTGTMRAPIISTSKVRINLKDKLAILDLPIQTMKYAGTNTSGLGKEGNVNDIKNKPKPLLFGRCKEVTPVQVNTALYIYQIHDGSIEAVESVKDSGVPLVFGTNRANLAAMQATPPAAGNYDTCLSEGLIRLNAPAAGKITVTARGNNTGGYVDDVVSIAARILTNYAGVVGSELSASNISTMSAAVPYEAGIYIDTERTIQSVINDLISSVGVWLVPNREGGWRFGQLIAPVGPPSFVFSENDIIGLELQSSEDENKSIPLHKVILRYGKNWTEFSETDLVGSLSAEIKNELIQQWREAANSDMTIKTKHLLSTELIKDSPLNIESEAISESLRQLNLHKVRRDYVTVDLRLDQEDNALIDIGTIIELQTFLLGYSSGRLFYVVGITADGARNKLTLQLWG